MSNVITSLPCGGDPSHNVTVDLDEGVVTSRVPSNGRRGSLHVPAHDVTADVVDDGDLAHWDCPRCEYADSTYVDPDVRADLVG